LAWDFHGSLVAPLLAPFVQKLKMLFDFEIDAQVVQCGSLGDSLASGNVVDAEVLQKAFLKSAGDWPGDTVTRDSMWLPPLLHFVAYKPSTSITLLDEDKAPQQSFAVPGWGAVVVVDGENEGCDDTSALLASNTTTTATYLSKCESQQVASAWVSHIRSWLDLPPFGHNEATDDDNPMLSVHIAPPGPAGMATWELRAVAHAIYSLFVKRAADKLEDTLELIDSLPTVAVRAELGKVIYQAAEAAKAATAAASVGDVPATLEAAREALRLALTASHDDTVVAHLHFSLEFRAAVYLPMALPVLLPLVLAILRSGQKARKTRALHRSPVIVAETS
jgi:phosphatidylinositol glycan class S